MTHEIIGIGNPDCDYTGGGIWVAFIPVRIDGREAELWYDSESYKNDDRNTVEFTVHTDGEEDGNYFENGTYIGTRDNSPAPYTELFDRLRETMKKALEADERAWNR